MTWQQKFWELFGKYGLLWRRREELTEALERSHEHNHRLARQNAKLQEDNAGLATANRRLSEDNAQLRADSANVRTVIDSEHADKINALTDKLAVGGS